MQLTTNRGFAPATLSEAIQFSDLLASSSMVPKAYQGKPQDILVCVQWGYEMGLAPMQALQNIAVINGKPSVYGDAAMALVQASPVCEDVEEYFENEGTPNPIAVCVAKRKGRKPVTAKFSVEDAKRAGLWGKQGPWSAYPKRMMQMRARGFALRDAFPDVLKGMITIEEAQDYPADDKPVAAAKQLPSNPLDLISHKTTVSEPVVVEEQHADIAEESVVDVVDASTGEITAGLVDGHPLFVPGKEEPFSVHATLEEWQDAYEDIANKTAKSTKRPARERMTLIKNLRDINDGTMSKISVVTRVRSTAAYSKRINALGAAQ